MFSKKAISLLKKVYHMGKQIKIKFRRKYITTIIAKKHYPYDSQEFIEGLKGIGINPGDSVFIMLSVDKIFMQTGYIIPVNVLLNDIISYLTSEGTLMVLGFSFERSKIIEKTKVFNINRTATECGILAEILRRKKGTVRSLHPIFSALAYGKNAVEYCCMHQKSPYPFDNTSPFFKIMENRGKYLGIGVGFEAFTPCHMIDDYYKNTFKHKIYYYKPEVFQMINYNGEEVQTESFIRNENSCPTVSDPHYYFKLLHISHQKKVLSNSGISIFSFLITDFFNAAIILYEEKKITIWDTGSPILWIRKILFNIIAYLSSKQ